MYFNSRPCVRGDGEYAGHRRRPRRFQFTPLREGRRVTAKTKKNWIVFQFTPLREGRQIEANGKRYRITLFQFTPLREGRPLDREIPVPGRNFNSRPCVRGDRRHIEAPANRRENFNSRPCVRGDFERMIIWKNLFHFNSRPCVRGDALRAAVNEMDEISIHAPA